MFVRKKSNRSGTTSVVVIEKRAGKTCYLNTIGVSSDPTEINKLYLQGQKWIAEQLGQRDMFLEHCRNAEEKYIVENLLSKVENIMLNGSQMILNPLFTRTSYVVQVLNPLDFNALKAVSICHRSLYACAASSGLLNEMMI